MNSEVEHSGTVYDDQGNAYRHVFTVAKSQGSYICVSTKPMLSGHTTYLPNINEPCDDDDDDSQGPFEIDPIDAVPDSFENSRFEQDAPRTDPSSMNDDENQQRLSSQGSNQSPGYDYEGDYYHEGGYDYDVMSSSSASEDDARRASESQDYGASVQSESASGSSSGYSDEGQYR